MIRDTLKIYTVKLTEVGSLRTRQNILTYAKSELRKGSPDPHSACMGHRTNGQSAILDDIIKNFLICLGSLCRNKGKGGKASLKCTFIHSLDSFRPPLLEFCQDPNAFYELSLATAPFFTLAIEIMTKNHLISCHFTAESQKRSSLHENPNCTNPTSVKKSTAFIPFLSDL